MAASQSSDRRPCLLLALAARFSTADPLLVEGWRYRRDLGVWVDADNPSALMVASGSLIHGAGPQPRPPNPPAPDKPRPRPASKKFDIETGEDMKGE